MKVLTTTSEANVTGRQQQLQQQEQQKQRDSHSTGITNIKMNPSLRLDIGISTSLGTETNTIGSLVLAEVPAIDLSSHDDNSTNGSTSTCTADSTRDTGIGNTKQFFTEFDLGKVTFDVPIDVLKACVLSSSVTKNTSLPSVVYDNHNDKEGDESKKAEYDDNLYDNETNVQYDENIIKDWIMENCLDKLRQSIRVRPMIVPNDICQLEKANNRLAVLDKITQVQRQSLLKAKPKHVFGELLESILDMTNSEYGFIGEVKYENDDTDDTTATTGGDSNSSSLGTMYLQTHAITNIAWNTATHDFYNNNIEFGLKFTNLNSLFGKVMTSKQTIIANDPSKHPSSCGIPEGHPPLNHFLGMPFFLPGGKEIIGMVGIANKVGGYSQADVDFLEPLTVTCSNLIQAYGIYHKNEYLINKLEDLVVQRTNELEKANQKVIEAARMQIEHFACMSHEIRTPLNCIVGLSSLLEDTELTSFQRDSISMIVNSGELLTAVVNDVLDYSKLQTENMDIDIQPINLQETLDSVVQSIDAKAQEKHIVLKTIYGCTVPSIISTDSRRLQQVLFNLLGNAIKFSYNNSIVELTIDVVSDDDNIMNRCGTTSNTSTSSTGSSCHAPLVSDDDDDNDNEQPNTSSTDAITPTATPQTVSDSSLSTTDDIDKCPFVPLQQQRLDHENENEQRMAGDLEIPDKCPFSKVNRSTTENVTSSVATTETITTETKVDNEPTTATTTQNRLRFTVKDYGKGIAQEDFYRIFQPFQQSKHGKKDTQVTEGTGLGLPITARLVKGLGGGEVVVTSEVGKFSEFTIEIPLVEDPVDLNSPVASSVLKNIHIILIDSAESRGTSFIVDCCAQKKIPLIEHDDCSVLQVLTNKYQNTNTTNMKDDSNIIHICLINEALYNDELYQSFAKCTNAALISFGPKYIIPNCNKHIRSLHRTLPSVLLGTIMSCFFEFQQQKQQPQQQQGNNTINLEKQTNILIDNGHHQDMNSGKILSSSQQERQAVSNKEVIERTSNAATTNMKTSMIGISSSTGSKTPSFEFRHVRALIAEDNTINQKILSSMLSRVGLQNIDIADNGLIAYEKTREVAYDIIFMDMQMPIMGGIEATRLIVKHYALLSSSTSNYRKKPIIIFVTAHATDDYKKEALDAGGDGFISKPFTLKSIQNLFATVLSSLLKDSTTCEI